MRWISLTLILLMFPIYLLNSSPKNYSAEIANRADSLYSKKSYKKALQQYLYISKSSDYIFNDPKFDYKLAHCYFQNGQYLHAAYPFAGGSNTDQFLWYEGMEFVDAGRYDPGDTKGKGPGHGL